MIFLFYVWPNSLNEWLQALSAVVSIIGILAILYNIRSYRLSQNQCLGVILVLHLKGMIRIT